MPRKSKKTTPAVNVITEHPSVEPDTVVHIEDLVGPFPLTPNYPTTQEEIEAVLAEGPPKRPLLSPMRTSPNAL